MSYIEQRLIGTVSVQEAADIAHVSHTTIRGAIRTGALRVVKVGRFERIKKNSLEKWLAGKIAASTAKAAAKEWKEEQGVHFDSAITPVVAFSMPPLALSMLDAARATGFSLAKIQSAAEVGRLPSVRFGRRTVILVDDLKSWLQSLKESSAITASPAEKDETDAPV